MTEATKTPLDAKAYAEKFHLYTAAFNKYLDGFFSKYPEEDDIPLVVSAMYVNLCGMLYYGGYDEDVVLGKLSEILRNTYADIRKAEDAVTGGKKDE